MWGKWGKPVSPERAIPVAFLVPFALSVAGIVVKSPAVVFVGLGLLAFEDLILIGASVFFAVKGTKK